MKKVSQFDKKIEIEPPLKKVRSIIMNLKKIHLKAEMK